MIAIAPLRPATARLLLLFMVVFGVIASLLFFLALAVAMDIQVDFHQRAICLGDASPITWPTQRDLNTSWIYFCRPGSIINYLIPAAGAATLVGAVLSAWLSYAWGQADLALARSAARRAGRMQVGSDLRKDILRSIHTLSQKNKATLRQIERIQSESHRRLGDTQRLFADFLDASHDVFFSIAWERREMLFISRGIERIVEREWGTFIFNQRFWFQCIAEGDRLKFVDAVESVDIDSPKGFLTIRLLRPNGTERLVEIIFTKSIDLDSHQGSVIDGVLRDVTDSSLLELDLRWASRY